MNSFQSRTDTISKSSSKVYLCAVQIYILLTNVYFRIEIDDAAHDQSIWSALPPKTDSTFLAIENRWTLNFNWVSDEARVDLPLIKPRMSSSFMSTHRNGSRRLHASFLVPRMKCDALKSVARTKKVGKINCRKLTHKVVNRNFLLFVNNSANLSFVTESRGRRKERQQQPTTGRYFGNRKLLDNLVIIEMGFPSLPHCDSLPGSDNEAIFLYQHKVCFLLFFSHRELSLGLHVECAKCSFEFNFIVIRWRRQEESLV